MKYLFFILFPIALSYAAKKAEPTNCAALIGQVAEIAKQNAFNHMIKDRENKRMADIASKAYDTQIAIDPYIFFKPLRDKNKNLLSSLLEESLNALEMKTSFARASAFRKIYFGAGDETTIGTKMYEALLSKLKDKDNYANLENLPISKQLGFKSFPDFISFMKRLENTPDAFALWLKTELKGYQDAPAEIENINAIAKAVKLSKKHPYLSEITRYAPSVLDLNEEYVQVANSDLILGAIQEELYHSVLKGARAFYNREMALNEIMSNEESIDIFAKRVIARLMAAVEFKHHRNAKNKGPYEALAKLLKQPDVVSELVANELLGDTAENLNAKLKKALPILRSKSDHKLDAIPVEKFNYNPTVYNIGADPGVIAFLTAVGQLGGLSAAMWTQHYLSVSINHALPNFSEYSGMGLGLTSTALLVGYLYNANKVGSMVSWTPDIQSIGEASPQINQFLNQPYSLRHSLLKRIEPAEQEAKTISETDSLDKSLNNLSTISNSTANEQVTQQVRE